MTRSFATRSFAAGLLAATLLAAPAFAQTTVIPMPAAPQPMAKGPPLATGIPATPLTSDDTAFVSKQLQTNMAEIKLAQLALQKSQDQNVRNYAQKLITDHTAADETLLPIANAQKIAQPGALDPEQQAMYDRLSRLNGVAFDTAYINGMISDHERDIKEMNAQLTHGQSQALNVWVQNTRPVVMQHEQIAQEIKDNLPRTG
jgi:putative membrane protein